MNLWHACQGGHSEPSLPAHGHSTATCPPAWHECPACMPRTTCPLRSRDELRGTSAHHTCPELWPTCACPEFQTCWCAPVPLIGTLCPKALPATVLGFASPNEGGPMMGILPCSGHHPEIANEWAGCKRQAWDLALVPGQSIAVQGCSDLCRWNRWCRLSRPNGVAVCYLE